MCTRINNYTYSVLAITIVILLSVGCGGGKPNYANTPKEVTRKLFDSLQENDANKYLDSITPNNRQQPGFFYYRQLIQEISGIVGLGQVEASKLKISFADLTIVEVNNNGGQATVSISGKLRDLNLALEQEFSTMVIVEKIDGIWLVSLSSKAEAEGLATAPVKSVPAQQKVAIPTITPEPVTPQLKMIGYNYTLKDIGDGWNEGKIYIAFENISDQLVGGETINISGGVVETQEGKTYPAALNSEFKYASGPESGISFGDLPIVVPPHFRWNRVQIAGVGSDTGVYFLKFRSAVAAHPVRIVFPTRPDLSLNLDSAQSTLVFPAEASFISAKPISSLAGKVLADDPAGLRVTLDGTGIGLFNYDSGLFLGYSVVNNDQLDSHEIRLASPFLAYFDDQGLIEAYLQGDPGQIFLVNAGPGQKKNNEFKLLYEPYLSKCDPNVYTIVNEAGQYALYNLNICK